MFLNGRDSESTISKIKGGYFASVAILISSLSGLARILLSTALSVDVHRRIFTLLGPSSCGKTTLLRMIISFISKAFGQIDKIINDIPTHLRNMGMVFQNYAVFPHMLPDKDNVAE